MTSHKPAHSKEEAPTAIIRVSESLASIDAEKWNRLEGCSRAHSHRIAYNPFVSHAFLLALEQSECAETKTGWLGQHLLLEDGQGNLLGALPCYLKSHSQGEYVFDHGWADAFERAGGRYYPKLQASVPFTPATGPRLLLAPETNAAAGSAALAQGLAKLTDQLGVSSAHVTFARSEEMAAFEQAGFLHRTDQQFHFTNEGYRDYPDFLETLSSRKRKNLKKERAAATAHIDTIEWLTGADITQTVLDDFYRFYVDTGSRKWGQPYLNRAFYRQIGETMADDILLIMAKRDGVYVAGAINFIGGDTLYGRHWGCIEDHRFLHFEICYHQAIDYAIANKLRFVEAGAQGEHKLARGYMPVTTHSAHYIPHPGFRKAVADYLEHERQDIARIGQFLETAGPYRKKD